jgi:hypothetical protein
MVGKTKREIGVEVACEIRKNRITGKRQTVKLQIYPSYGIDDTGSIIDFLTNEGHWNKSGSTIEATEFKINSTRTALINHIETKNLVPKLRAVAGRAWKKIGQALSLSRKPKYGNE